MSTVVFTLSKNKHCILKSAIQGKIFGITWPQFVAFTVMHTGPADLFPAGFEINFEIALSDPWYVLSNLLHGNCFTQTIPRGGEK